ncbi:MAG: AraC family transcriptional regulator [Bacillota bacterium]|jgi:AraC family transcriptional regulator|nr:AraC family transcriptional regulator [Bacillota bacterium]HOB91480.1 AraC family transcriptional regulator [Bacillota bacterium]HPZ54889.1 AraC family transcriptional regulator [Bacillota bacterium]HQD17660.1 AraC family transcriptional regulator [Bacillota bacterium]
MERFQRISEVLHYIEEHLYEIEDYEQVADAFCFSPYYFHRLFSAVVGKPIGSYIRERRLAKAAELLTDLDKTITSICFECGFNSSQSFCRSFKNSYGVSPSEYRKQGYTPVVMSVEEIIEKFAKKLRGGILVHPKMIKRGKLLIAGVTGDGSKTRELWEKFTELHRRIGFKNKVSDNAYEVRIYDDNKCTCHVGVCVSDPQVDSSFTVLELPASTYAAFEVYVARGYDSENDAMDEWLEANKERHRQRTIDGNPYVVEFYDERFQGDSEDSIVEIWVPIEEVK